MLNSLFKMLNCALTVLNYVFKMLTFVLKMLNSVLKVLNSALKVLNSMFKMLNSVFENAARTSGRTHFTTRSRTTWTAKVRFRGRFRAVFGPVLGHFWAICCYISPVLRCSDAVLMLFLLFWCRLLRCFGAVSCRFCTDSVLKKRRFYQVPTVGSGAGWSCTCSENGDFRLKNGGFRLKNDDFPVKSGDFLLKIVDFLIKCSYKSEVAIFESAGGACIGCVLMKGAKFILFDTKFHHFQCKIHRLRAHVWIYYYTAILLTMLR